MIQRCTNPRVPFFASYGGRGITVCAPWRKFTAFFADMGSRPSPKHQLERKDNSLGYSPENCIWMLSKNQQKNTRRTIFVTHGGATLCLKDWCVRLNLNYGTVRHRIYRGDSPLTAILKK